MAYAFSMDFGDRLKKARTDKGLSQERLGEGLGVNESDVTKQTVYGWESNKHSPTARQLALLCERLGHSADWFLFGKELHDLRMEVIPAGVGDSIEPLAALLMPVDPATRETIATLLADMARHPERGVQIAAAVKAVSAITTGVTVSELPAKPASTVQTMKDLSHVGNPLLHVKKQHPYKKAAK